MDFVTAIYVIGVAIIGWEAYRSFKPSSCGDQIVFWLFFVFVAIPVYAVVLWGMYAVWCGHGFDWACN